MIPTDGRTCRRPMWMRMEFTRRASINRRRDKKQFSITDRKCHGACLGLLNARSEQWRPESFQKHRVYREHPLAQRPPPKRAWHPAACAQSGKVILGHPPRLLPRPLQDARWLAAQAGESPVPDTPQEPFLAATARTTAAYGALWQRARYPGMVCVLSGTSRP